MENRFVKEKYLDDNVFIGLQNINSGFDSPSIKYFTESDFKMVLDRVESLNLGVYGIEPWRNGEFYDVLTCKDFGKTPTDSNWYKKAFEKFKSSNLELQYAASYYIPQFEK